MTSIPQQSTEGQPIQLGWDGPKVAVAPGDHDRFVKEVQRAVLVGQNGLAIERFWQQFTDEFLPAIHHWCEEHKDRVAACFVPFPKDHVKVFVVRRSQTYDFTLSDDLSDLEMDLFEKQWPSEILQIPRGYLESYFDPGASIQIYGNGG